MAKLIGTAGHVDHGKTSLIAALTGIDADRLPEERRRGMTIDIGFAHIEIPGIGKVSIVDVPGHEKFLTNMLVGALGMDVALLCVAADESVKPQTREHLQILDLLPVEKLVVALTRADLADETMRAISREETEGLLEETRFARSPIVDVSAITGEGLELIRAELAKALEDADQRLAKGAWYLPIDRAFNVKGHGAVVTGTLGQGKVSVGDRAIIVPGMAECRVRGIEWHDDPQDFSEKGRRTALNLGGVKLEAVQRGQAVGAEGSLFETKLLDARVRWLVPAEHGLRVRVALGSADAIGRVFLNDKDLAIAQIRLERPVAAAQGQPLIIRRYSPPDLLGGGRVLVPVAKPRRKTEKAVAVDDRVSLERQVLTLVSDSEAGMLTEELCRLLGKSPQQLGEDLEKLKHKRQLLGFAGLWLSPERYGVAAGELVRVLEKLHREKPTRAGLPRDQVVQASGLAWSGKPLERILAKLADDGRIKILGNEIAKADFFVEIVGRQRELLDRVKQELQREGINVQPPEELARSLGVPPQAVSQILAIGIQAGEIIRISESIYYTSDQIEQLKALVRELGNKGPFTAAEFRDRSHSSRKYSIPLLEYFDTIRLTTRVGDSRALNL